MGHSVERHLSVTPATYDTAIRRFIPGYEAMLDEVDGALAELLGKDTRAHVLDLGAGTGSLTERIAAHLPAARFTLIDADPAMLAQAESRLQVVRGRVTMIQGSFAEKLPDCDAVVAAFALHHVHDPEAKQDVYRNIHRALGSGGPLVIADAMMPETGPLAEPLRRRWAAHLVAHGDSEAAAYARFAEWAREDRYFALDDELRALRTCGFAAVDVRWRLGPTAVVVACKG